MPLVKKVKGTYDNYKSLQKCLNIHSLSFYIIPPGHTYLFVGVGVMLLMWNMKYIWKYIFDFKEFFLLSLNLNFVFEWFNGLG